MLQPADYHMHTPLCRHASGEPVEYARQAASLGLLQIGFSDHSPMERDDFDEWRMRMDQLDEYVAKVQIARQAVPGLKIRLALEVDYLPGQEAWIRNLASRHPWDYLIGSVHYITDTWDVDNPAKISQWRQHEAHVVWKMYFERLAQAADSGLFDIIGHADLPKKFGIRPVMDCRPLYEPFLKAAALRGCAVELNTAGLRKDCREIYPSRELLEMARGHGVNITFGSDAHQPSEVGMNFVEARDLALSVGYTHWLEFQGRRATPQAL